VVVQQGGSHLGATGVVDAHEQHFGAGRHAAYLLADSVAGSPGASTVDSCASTSGCTR
jgi:hypothetical protein